MVWLPDGEKFLEDMFICIDRMYERDRHTPHDHMSRACIASRGKNRDSGRMAGYRLMTAEVRDQQLTFVGAVVYNSYGARLFTAQRPRHASCSEYAEHKRTEQNLSVI